MPRISLIRTNTRCTYSRLRPVPCRSSVPLIPKISPAQGNLQPYIRDLWFGTEARSRHARVGANRSARGPVSVPRSHPRGKSRSPAGEAPILASGYRPGCGCRYGAYHPLSHGTKFNNERYYLVNLARVEGWYRRLLTVRPGARTVPCCWHHTHLTRIFTYNRLILELLNGR